MKEGGGKRGGRGQERRAGGPRPYALWAASRCARLCRQPCRGGVPPRQTAKTTLVKPGATLTVVL